MKEKEVIKRCKNGEKDAFDELIRSFYPYVTKYLLKLTGNQILTEDLTQEVFLKVIRSIDNYNIGGKASFATYIITIAKNTFIDYARRNRIICDDISETDISCGIDTETQVIEKTEYAEAIRYINSLPPKQAQVIKLKYIDEYTLKEIESITGIPSKTVKSRIQEGTKKLRKLWKGND